MRLRPTSPPARLAALSALVAVALGAFGWAEEHGRVEPSRLPPLVPVGIALDRPGPQGGAVVDQGHAGFDLGLEVLGLPASRQALPPAVDALLAGTMAQLAATPAGIPVEGWYSRGYGWRSDPWTGEREFHRGVDIVASAGTPVGAAADGVVARVADEADYGRVIDVAHGFGYATRYAHLQEVAVRTGDPVRRGETIGLVGTTGRTTGAHLHYEIFRDGRRINPWRYLGHSAD